MSRNASRGFTLIEVLIVVAISAMLSSFAIVYSRVGQNQVALSVDEAKISQLILQAKELAISTYSGAGSSCAYGVAFNYGAQTYSLFAYSPAVGASNRCPSAATMTTVAGSEMEKYADGSWNLSIADGVVMDGSAADSLSIVLFYPPLPTTLIMRKGAVTFLAPGQTSKIHLSTANGSASVEISVSPAGQVEFK